MAFKKTVKYRTPDGVEHDTATAAKAHMLASNYGVLGQATSQDFEDAVKHPATENAALIAIRNAIREVYLLAWPRANVGKPRPRKATEAAPTSHKRKR